MELSSVLSLEAAAQAVEEEAQTEAAPPDDLLQYCDGLLPVTVPHGLQQLRELSDTQDVV